MIAAIINAVLVMLGSAAGLMFQKHISERVSRAIFTALGLCTLCIGISGAIKTENILCMIVSMVCGTALGEALRIEERIDRLGEKLRARVADNSGASRFTQGFVSATLLFCVGAMAIMGSIEAGVNGNYAIIISKSAMDCVAAVAFAAAMGIGVMFSSLSVLVYQGSITLLAMWLGPMLPTAVMTEMSAVGGLLIIGLGLNMLGVAGNRPLKVGNMLPAMFLPLLFIPLASLIANLF